MTVRRKEEASPASAPSARIGMDPPPRGRTLAYVGLGSNLGDRLEYLREACAALAAMEGIETKPEWTSRIYETAPVGTRAGDGPFLNAVIGVETTLLPPELLAGLLAIEAQLGRKRDGRLGAPRTIDLDLLLYGDVVIQAPNLQVPHPRLMERRFVLEPLCELCPGLMDPITGRTIRSLAGACREAHPDQTLTILEFDLWP